MPTLRSPFSSFLCAILVLLPLSSVSLAESRDNTPINLREFQGKVIGTVSVEVKDVFEDPGQSFFYNQANNLKKNTREEVVRRELLFKEGDTFDHFLIQESERNLRAQRFLRNISVTPVASGDVVNIKVSVQDTWTFLPQVNFSSGSGQNNRSIGILESDVWGMGKRAELLLSEEDNRRSLEAVYADPRVWGSSLSFVGAEFHRNDGDRTLVSLSNPFRTLVDKTAWQTDGDISDTVGRLFAGGDERYIYRQQTTDVGLSHTWAFGDPERTLHRYTIGYEYIDNSFSQADSGDYADLDLDPNVVSNDLSMLAENRRFSGPSFGYRSLSSNFVSMNYIDRFDRVDDFDLGDNFDLKFTIAPEILGSINNTLLVSGTRAAGAQFSPSSFLRGEFGFSTRRATDEFENTLLRYETRYYNVLGPLFAKGLFLGKHTIAAGITLDYGMDLDKDRELLLGAENGLRGYESKTFTGDKRLIMNLEERVHLVEDAFKLVSVGAAAFVDGGATSDGNFGDLLTNDLYGDVGVGLRLAFPRSSGGRMLRLDIAFPFRDGPDESRGWEARIIFAGGPLFSSRLRSESVGSEKANVEVGLDK